MGPRPRLIWVVALLALLFGPARLADEGDHADAKSLSAAALAPTVSSADVARSGPVEERAEDVARSRPASSPPISAPAAALLALALATPLVQEAPRAGYRLGWRRRGPPLLPA
jgi:hypothetical protein